MRKVSQDKSVVIQSRELGCGLAGSMGDLDKRAKESAMRRQKEMAGEDEDSDEELNGG